MTYFRILLYLFFVVTVNACSTHNFKNEIKKANNTDLGVVLVQMPNQDKFEIEGGINRPFTILGVYGGAIGGAIGAIIDEALVDANSEKNKLLLPINLHLSNVDVSSLVNQKIRESIAAEGWLRFSKVISSEEFKNTIYPKGKYFLSFSTRYVFSEELDYFRIDVSVVVSRLYRNVHRGERISKRMQEVYSNHYRFVSKIQPDVTSQSSILTAMKKDIKKWYDSEKRQIVKNYKTEVMRKRHHQKLTEQYNSKMAVMERPIRSKDAKKIRAQIWAENQSKRVKDNLKEALQSFDKIISYDFQEAEFVKNKKYRKQLERYARNFAIIYKDSNRVIIEEATGGICSIPLGESPSLC